jgi:hypothetical protein
VKSKDDTLNDVDSNNPDMLVQTVIESFEQHLTAVKKCSSEPNSIGCKMLITTDGLKQLHTIHSNAKFNTWCAVNKVSTFAFSSDLGDFHNFNSVGRQQALESMSNLSLTDNVILFHYDILTEGIDLPAITGVMLMRDLPLSKLLQNIGRGARLIPTDRKKLYSNEINPTDLDKMIKPFCWVIIPSFFKALVGDDRMFDIVKTLRDTYDIQLELMGDEDIALADSEHYADRVTATDVRGIKNKTGDLEHIFEEIIIDEFNEDVKNLNNPIPELESIIGTL